MLGLEVLHALRRKRKSWHRAITTVREAYERVHRRRARLLKPRRFTEKVQWRKLFDFNPVFSTLCDKLAVRAYISSRIGDDHLIPLLWSGSPHAFLFADLRPPYVVKSTHASGHVVFVEEDTQLDKAAFHGLASSWLAQSYARENIEPGYARVPPQLIVERKITAPGGGSPQEIRFFVFDGKVAVVNSVFWEDGRIRNGAFHTPDWQRLHWHFNRLVDKDFPPPERLQDMIRLAESLGADLDHVRVDFYDCGKTIWIGEITLYAWSGLSAFQPDEADFLLGAFWNLRRPLWRALKAILQHDHEL